MFYDEGISNKYEKLKKSAENVESLDPDVRENAYRDKFKLEELEKRSRGKVLNSYNVIEYFTLSESLLKEQAIRESLREDLITEAKTQAKISKGKAEAQTKRYEALMNMNIEELINSKEGYHQLKSKIKNQK